jgi:hypothetical protein
MKTNDREAGRESAAASIWIAAIAALAALAALACSGCATVMNGKSQRIDVRTRPPKAAVSVYDSAGKLVGQGLSPCGFTLARGAGYFKAAAYELEISAEGFMTAKIKLRPKLSDWYMYGNILASSLFGWLIVDPITGGMWEFSPGSVDTNLDAIVGSGEGGGE